MHHGFGILDKAIDVLKKEDREEFRNYVNTRTYYNPHIMFISKKILWKNILMMFFRGY